MARFRWRKKVRTGRVVAKIVATVLALWVGGEVITQVAVAMNTTTTPFATGLGLIGFGHSSGTMDGTVSTTGLLSVVGLVAMASIITEFVQISF